jgi:hypothetical protein
VFEFGGRSVSAFGQHIQTTEEIKALKAKIAQLRGGLQRSIALPTATEAARNVALEEEVDRLRAELANARRTAEYWKAEHLAGNAELDALRQQEPCAWMDCEGDVYWTKPDDNWCPPHKALYAAPAPSIPPGYQLVPIEPTWDMKREGIHTDIPVSLSFTEVTAVWAAMLEAAAKDEKC